MMKHEVTIDLRKMFFYFLKRIWLPILCAAVGFTLMYQRASSRRVETFTAYGTMYVFNGNTNMLNYQYISQTDLNTAVQLIDTYTIVIRSDKVMDVVAERLSDRYTIEPGMIASTINMVPIKETAVVRVTCTFPNPVMAADICNAVLDVAPQAIKDVVGAGDFNVIDYAKVPLAPNPYPVMGPAVTGALMGAAGAMLLLLVLFLMNHRVSDVQEITDRYTPPVLASIRRIGGKDGDPERYRLSEKSSMDIVENYAKLRTNVFYTLPENDRRVVAVTSSVASEGKSTVAANLAISVALSGLRVVLVDGDLRRACQRDMFMYDDKAPGLADVLVGRCGWHEALLATEWETLHVMPAGHVAPNPARLLSSQIMETMLNEMLAEYDLVLIDTPPVNVVSDALIMTKLTAGTLFVVRQHFSDHREIRKALVSAEMAGMNLLGFVFYGSGDGQENHYSRRRYRSYYHRNDGLSAEGGDDDGFQRVQKEEERK